MLHVAAGWLAALAFASARSRSILLALAREPRSLGGLRQELGLSMSLLHYHVAKLLKLGLVAVVRRNARAGRAITVYSAVASSFVVPTRLVEHTGADRLRKELFATLERDAVRRPADTIVYDLAADRTPRMRRVRDQSGSSAAGEWWSRLQLSDRDAADLVAELRDVIGRYGRRSGTGRPYLLHLAIAEAE